MKSEKLVWGLILVFIGGVILLENFEVIDFYWSSVWRFWPLALILIGVNMIFSRSDIISGPYVALVTTILALGFIFYQGTTAPKNGRGWFHYENNDTDSDSDSDQASWEGNTFTEPYIDSIKYAELNISGGATSFQLEDSTANLIQAEIKQNNSGYTLTSETKDSLQVISFKAKSGRNKKFRFGNVDGNDVKIKLNTLPIWDINMNMGASESDFDLTAFKVSNLSIHGGAASFKAKLGEPVTTTTVSAETGVAEVKIKVPKSVGCQIKVRSGLSSKDFSGFTKQANGTYVTSNFTTADKKIIITLKGGLSEFEVTRY